MDALFAYFDLMGRTITKWKTSSVEVFLLHMKLLFRVGLDDSQRSLPTPTILWFCN